MIRRSTAVYITILIAVLAVFMYFNTRKEPANAESTPGPDTEVSYLFQDADGTPTSIFVEAKSGETLELTRNAEGAWSLKQPLMAAAEQGSSEAAASQVLAMRILEKIDKIDPDLVGLKEPAYILTVKFSNGTERSAHIGVVTPSDSGYYVQDSSGGNVLIISKSSVDALLGLLNAPPYLESPTPSAFPSETDSAAATIAPTP
jgi:hypothetical protein